MSTPPSAHSPGTGAAAHRYLQLAAFCLRSAHTSQAMNISFNCTALMSGKGLQKRSNNQPPSSAACKNNFVISRLTLCPLAHLHGTRIRKQTLLLKTLSANQGVQAPKLFKAKHSKFGFGKHDLSQQLSLFPARNGNTFCQTLTTCLQGKKIKKKQ